MTYIQGPDAEDLPTTRQLARATALAAAAAAAILVTAVLPAEYGIDPTGAGRVLGLTAMGELKWDEAALPKAGAAETPMTAPAEPVGAAGTRTEEVRLTLAPNEGTEVKATMRTGEQLDYDWSTDGAEVRFELHGEELGAAADEYTSYEKGASKGETGTFRAPFDGTHGWYWRNRSGRPVAVTVRASGTFQKFERKG